MEKVSVFTTFRLCSLNFYAQSHFKSTLFDENKQPVPPPT